jgi:hypothetical protein
MTAERISSRPPSPPSGTGPGPEVAKGLSTRFAERGWRCLAEVRPAPSGGEEVIVIDRGAVSPDRSTLTFPVDGRPVPEQVEGVLADLEHRGWAGPPLGRAALWCEPT